MKNDFINILSFSGLSLIFSIFFCTVLLFFADVNITSFHFIICNIFSVVISSILFNDFKKVFFAHIINYIIFYVLALFYYQTKDFSSDVLLYHLPVIKMLLTGWNPVDLNTAYIPSHSWSKYFAKAPWIIDAVIASFFKNLEIARILNAFLIYISILFSYALLKNYIKNNKKCSIILSLIIGFNTISLVQSLTFLVDGFLSSCLIIFISSVFLYYKARNKIWLFAILFSISLTVNAKLSAIAYILIIGTGVIYFLKKDFKYIIIFVVSIFISLFIIGFNPYTINTIKHHNPFYPIGDRELKIVEDFCPKEISKKFYLTKFAISQFAEANANMDDPVKIKVPFSITNNEIKIANSPQLNLSGFGFLYSGVLILTFLFIILSFKRKWYKNFLILESILLASVFINPECWWARFVPQFYLFPCFLAAFLLADENKNSKIQAYILIFVMFLNTFITGFFYFKRTFEYQKIQNELTYMLQNYKGVIYVDSKIMNIEGVKIKLDNYSIKYKEYNGIECNGINFKYSTIPLCLISEK